MFGPFFRGPTWVVVAGVPRGAVRVAADARAARALQQAHRPQHATDKPLHEAWLGIWPSRRKIFHPRCHRDLPCSFKDWRPFLGPGEVGTIMIIAADRRQARVIMRYCLGLLKSVPMLAQLIESETRESVSCAIAS